MKELFVPILQMSLLRPEDFFMPSTTERGGAMAKQAAQGMLGHEGVGEAWVGPQGH